MVGTWLIIFLSLLFLELITINLVSIWFAIGALGAMIASCITENITIQIIIFIMLSIVSLLFTKPFVQRVRKRKIVPTNLDTVIGQIGVVTKKITKNDNGEVKVGGKIWTAKSSRSIDASKEVRILKIEGVKLLVEEVKED